MSRPTKMTHGSVLQPVTLVRVGGVTIAPKHLRSKDIAASIAAALPSVATFRSSFCPCVPVAMNSSAAIPGKMRSRLMQTRKGLEVS